MDTAAFIEAFRAAFPEFSDRETYSDSIVTFWSGAAVRLVNEARWGDLYERGMMLVLAHHLALAIRKPGTRRTAPGAIPSRVASKSVDKVSVSYDTNSGVLTEAGMWGLTTYGTEFYQLSLMLGAGGLQM